MEQHLYSKEEVNIKLEDGGILSIFAEKEIEANTLLELPIESSKSNGEEPIQLLEGRSYEYELPKDYELKAIPRIVLPSRRTGNKHHGRITPGIYVGRLAFTVVPPEEESFEIAVEVRSIKADYRTEYRKMLKDITEECMELIMLHSSPVTQRVTVDYNGDPETLYQRFAFVKSIVDSERFRNAIHRVISMPVTAWSHQIEETDIRRSRRITSRQIRQIATRSNRINLPETHPLYSKIKSVPARLPTEIKIDTVDTPENRFIKHALKEFERFCGIICYHIEKKQADPTKRPHIYNEAKELEKRFSGYLNHNMFHEVSGLQSLPLNSPILQRKEGYREILRVWLMFDLAAKLIWNALDDDQYYVGKRDVAALYEYWLFFKLLRLVEDIFEMKSTDIKKLIKKNDDQLGLTLLAGRHTRIKGEYNRNNRNFRIQFSYNRPFGRSDHPNSGSWTQPMRPDYTLSLWPAAFSEEEAEKQEMIVHVHFDAKYKVEGLKYLTVENNKISEEEQSKILSDEKELQKQGTYKRADLLKMHAYKDAIRRTVGAYVLYPGKKIYERHGFHEIIPGLGAFPVSPSNNGEGLKEIRDFINDIIEHMANRASQREEFSYHKYKIHENKECDVLHDILPEYISETGVRAVPPSNLTVLIGYYNKDQYQWIKDKKRYNIRIDSKNGLIKYGPEEMGASYLLLHGKDI